MIVVVTGYRNWDNPGAVYVALDTVRLEAEDHHDQLLVLHGNCGTGADRFAATWCRNHGATVWHLSAPARWDWSGRGGGPQRNVAMLDIAATLHEGLVAHQRVVPRVLAFPAQDSVGTVRCMTKARELGFEVVDLGIRTGAPDHAGSESD